MAMFGGFSRSRSPFQAQPPLTTPGIGDGLPGATPMGSYISPETRSILDNAPPAKPGFGTKDVIGIIGDALSAAGGGQGVYTQMKLQDRQRERMLEQAQLQRQADMQDWVAKERYKADHPTTPQPTEFERVLDAAGFSPEEKLRLLQQRARNTADPLQAVKTYGADGSEGLQFIRPSQMQGGGDPSLGGAGSPPAPSPSADLRDFITPDQMRSIAGGTNFQKWQQQMQTPVLVRSAEEMAGLPAGTLVVSPDGRRGVKK